MAAKDSEAAPTIVVKRYKKAGHAHHGGSWKVAFADFATAMMAFFLLMWLMGATTEKQKGAISEYFNNPSSIQGASPVPSPSPINGPGGASTSMIKLGGGMELHHDPAPPPAEAAPPQLGAQVDVTPEDGGEEKADEERLKGLVAQLKEGIDLRESLAQYKDQILLDVTPEGVRIQIIDHERRSMFPSGSAQLEGFSADILRELSSIINNVPNRISISGHTDIRPLARLNYSNWELSADRANAARRALIAGGLPAAKIGRVVGLSSSTLLEPTEPENPVNRRISIVVMNKRTEAAITQENGALLSVQHTEGGTKEDAPEPAATEAPATIAQTVATP